ncbi:hypothetical protein ACFVUH_09560 [Kitasatospora sp. NPDC058032]|uniref:hypothetical protein n=1 Tax=Kitasatospora sp. NPDC058032 TaxID=3346307 RepID=UPI0036DAB822
MPTPHILLPGERVSLAMTNRDHLADYHRWENDPGTILGFGTQVAQSWEVRAGGWEGQGRNATTPSSRWSPATTTRRSGSRPSRSTLP